jgi:hypothetical protein
MAYALTAVDNKPSTMLFYSGIGVSIHVTKGKLRAGMKCGFGSRAPDRAAYARTFPYVPRTHRSAPHFAAWCAAEPGP